MGPRAYDQAPALAWLGAELHEAKDEAAPMIDPTASLCANLRDGRVLCRLVQRLSEDDAALPKKLARSMHQLSTFHALERVQFFIRWCRDVVRLEEQHIFTTVQLLDEANASAVGACVDALRLRFRPKGVDDDHDGSGRQQAGDEDELEPVATSSTSSGEDHDDALTTAAPPVSSSRLTAFLSQFPGGAETTAPTTATTTTTETRPSSTKRLPGRDSLTSLSSAATAENADEDDDEHELVLRGTTTTPVKTPSEDRPRPASMRNPVAKLEIPAVFGRQQSLPEDKTPTAPAVAAAAVEDATTTNTRSVSKLQIPAAFAATPAAPAPAPTTIAPSPQPPSPEVPTAAPSSPRSSVGSASRLEIPAAFAHGVRKSLSPQVSPEKPPAAPSKLSIPAAFGAVVTSSSDPPRASAPISEKRASKLAAFLSTVEVAPASAPAAAFAEDSDPARAETDEAVTPAASSVAEVEEVAHEEEVIAPATESEPVVTATPEPIESAEEEEASSRDLEGRRSQQRSAKLLAFLAAVPPPQVDATPEATTASHEGELDPIVEPSGAVVHEAIDSPIKSTASRRESPRSPTKAKRALFKDSDESEHNMAHHMHPEFQKLKEDHAQLVISNQKVVAKLEAAEASVAEQKTLVEKMRLELDELKQQLESQRLAAATELELALANQAAKFDVTKDELVARHTSEIEDLVAAAQKDKKDLEASLADAKVSSDAAIAQLLARHDADLLAAQKGSPTELARVEEEARGARQLAQERAQEIARLQDELVAQRHATELAKDSEEAARFSAQTAFAARAEAEDLNRTLLEKIDSLMRGA